MNVMKKLLVTLLILMLSGAFFLFMIWKKVHEPIYIENTLLVLPKGTGLNKTAYLLREKNIIENEWLFIGYARLMGITEALKAGEYQFKGLYSLPEVAHKIVEGKVVVRSVTIAEGKSLAEIKEILLANPYLSGEITVELKEGDILPETYHFAKGESRNSILRKAQKAMRKVLHETYLNMAHDLPIESEKELLILASIVEKETGIANERKQVASVFVNRLRIGMRLQTDPTVIYAVTDGKMNLGRPLYKKDLKFDSPYNTYIYAGLPPTPICSPGKDAILSAANPDKTKYLYFVADGETGGHRFAKTLDEHNRNVAIYRQKMRKNNRGSL